MSPRTETPTAALAELLGAGTVDANPTVTVAGVPVGAVARPADVDGVCRVMAFAHEHGLTVVPSGSGTKLDLGNPPESVDVLLDLSGLDEVTEYDAENLTIAAQAGARVADIQERVAADSLFFPVHPAFPDRATVGGVVASRDNGAKRFGHGNLRDVVLGIKLVRADGELVKFGGRTIKNVSGYDVTKLLIGSLGTLGVIVEVTFRLLPAPQREDVLLHAFPKLTDAATLSAKLLDSVLVPTAVELVSPSARQFLPGLPADFAPGEYVLAVGLEGHPDAVVRQERDLTVMCSNLAPNRTALISGGGYVAEGAEPAPSEVACDIHETVEACHCAALSDGTTVEALWDGVADMQRAAAGAGYAVAAKLAVPLSRVWELASALEKSAAANGVDVAYRVGCAAGVINLYLRGETAAAIAVLEDLRTLARRREGSLVLLTSSPLEGAFETWGEPGPEQRVFRAIKAQYDPRGILNVGRFVGRI